MAAEDTSQNESTEEGGGASSALEGIGWGLRALLKHWPIIAACVLLGTGIALAYSKSQPKIYEAATLIEFDPDVIKPLGNKTDPMVGWSAVWDTKEYYETQYRIIQSDRVLSSVVRDLGLQNDPEFLGYKPTSPASLESVTAMLRSKLTVDPAKGSRLVYLRVQDTRPAQARRLSEAISKAYIRHNLDKMLSDTADTVVWLSGQLDHFKHELEQTEDSLHEFKKQNDLPSSTLEDLSKMIRLEMQEYDGALTRTRLRRSELAARHAELSKINTENPDQIPASELLSNVFLGELRKNYQDASRERAELLAEGKGENHPAVSKANEKVKLTKGHLVNEIRTIQGAVARDLAIIQQQEGGEAGLYEGAKKKAVDLNLKELEFHRLDRLRAQNEKLYAVLLEQLKEADLRRMMNTNNIRLIDTPVEPKTPIFPKTSMNVGIGFATALIIGLALALLREAVDNTLKKPEDLEKRLGVTFLGLLPALEEDDDPTNKKKRKARRLQAQAEIAPELLVHERPASGIAEAARSLRTNLMFMNPDQPFRRILVTSAAPSEGKTTVACAIAISLAQGGQRICIIDCDLRRPRLHRIFDRAGDIGVMNVIMGEATIEEAAKPTIVPNLFCIPCGPIPPNSADIIASEKFRKFLDELSKHFDRIVLDSPPVVAVTDSAILSTLCDGVVMVMRSFKTTFALARSGLRTLRDVDAPIAGAVLNAVNLNRHEYSYQRYYYYRREGYAPLTQAEVDQITSTSSPAPPPN